MVNILGINVSTLNENTILEKLNSFLNSNTAHQVVTANPEIILKTNKDEEYFHIVNHADLVVADGFGLVLAGLLKGRKISRLTGSDLTIYLLEKAELEGIKVLVINRQDGLSTSKEIKNSLLQKWPKLKLNIIDLETKEQLTVEEKEMLNKISAELIFVGLGAPWQEKIIAKELKNFLTTRLAIGIGGSFDFLTNKIKRSPKLLRTVGLEWLWRVLAQPQNRIKRLKRIYQATIVFTYKMFKNVLINPFFYRNNVAIILYKEDNILLVKRRNEDHWQLPQGGLDGESLIKGGSREIREELNTNKFIVKNSFKNLYKYKFKEENYKNKRKFIHNYKGQSQGLLIAEFTGEDKDIKINYWDHDDWKWVKDNELLTEVHSRRLKGSKIFLNKFKNLNNK